MNYENEIESLLRKLPHKFRARYALACALEVKDLIKEPKALVCLELVEKWLENDKSVTPEDLHAAAYAAAHAARAARAAAYAADAAAHAAYAAYAAHAAAHAAYAAAHAARAARAAAYAADAARAGKTSEYYYNLLLIMINRDMTTVERIICELE